MTKPKRSLQLSLWYLRQSGICMSVQDQQEVGLLRLQGQRQHVGPHDDPESWPAPMQVGCPNCGCAFRQQVQPYITVSL